MEKEILEKWESVVANIKDGKSVKVRRDTVCKGVTKPFGTLTRNGEIITFEPARGCRAYRTVKSSDKMPAWLTDTELLAAFSF